VNLWDFLSGSLWPLVAITVVLVYRTSISEFIGRIKSAQLAGSKVDLNPLEQATDNLLYADVKKPKPPGTLVDDVTTKRAIADRATLAQISPAALIMESYREVEIAMRDLVIAVEKGDSSTDTTMMVANPASVLHYLISTRTITPALDQVIQQLRQLRNAVTHTREEPTTAIALAYAESASLAASYLRLAIQKLAGEPPISS
jgi:hypothetical protein